MNNSDWEIRFLLIVNFNSFHRGLSHVIPHAQPRAALPHLPFRTCTDLLRRDRLCENQPVPVQIHDVELDHPVILRAQWTRYRHVRQS